jgi:hypothetical protein
MWSLVEGRTEWTQGMTLMMGSVRRQPGRKEGLLGTGAWFAVDAVWRKERKERFVVWDA